MPNISVPTYSEFRHLSTKFRKSSTVIERVTVNVQCAGSLYLVSTDHDIRMVPFVRSHEELFESTLKRTSAIEKFKVVINGPTYGLSYIAKLDALSGSDPVAANETIQQGQIVLNKKVIGGTRSDMYFVRFDTGSAQRYRFGRGAAPLDADSALGNMDPFIINKLQYGSTNLYKPPQEQAVLKGKPNSEHARFLTQRSNARFTETSNLSDMSGKVVLGYRYDKAQLIILIQPHGTPGTSIAGLRDILSSMGLDSAVYLDGSDSVMLMLDNNLLIPQASNKNETNVTGVEFAY